MTVKNNFDIPFSIFFLNLTDIHALKLVLNFHPSIRKTLIFIKQKLQKNVKFSEFNYSPKNG